MGRNPYSDLPRKAFWKTGVVQANPSAIEGIYKKKFDIPPKAKIVAAGSCFAQHISRYLKKNGYNVLDVEPPPQDLPDDQHLKFGYSMYSARYGNIYTVRQLLQLAREVAGEWSPKNYVWEKNGKFVDALRPAVEPDGLDTPEEVIEHRRLHISKVKSLFKRLDLFIFTLGLTEMWTHKESGTVYPTAPGTLAGEFDGTIYEFTNASFLSIKRDFNQFQKVLKRIRGGRPFKVLLTVSPVPLTATASGKHVLHSTIYSKSILRGVAEELSINKSRVDYFPSYEIVTNPITQSNAFSNNLRTVKDETVEIVMKHFFAEHPSLRSKFEDIDLSDEKILVQCEEELTELFMSGSPKFEHKKKRFIEIYGSSHTNSFVKSVRKVDEIVDQNALKIIHHAVRNPSYDYFKPFEDSDLRVPDRELITPWMQACIDGVSNFNSKGMKRRAIVFVGVLHGDRIIRLFGRLGNTCDISPKIPIIKCRDEIPSSFYEAAENQIKRYANIARKLVKRKVQVYHIFAPMMHESGAKARFGDVYVDSGSQSIYNDAYACVVRKLLGDDVADKVLIPHDETCFADSGFLLDKYSSNDNSKEIHAGAEFYDSSVRTLLERMSARRIENLRRKARNSKS